AGFVTFLVTLAIGAMMIALGTTAARTVSQSAAYTVATEFKSGHFATMHGILILPALAWLVTFADWTESRRVKVIALACVGYVLAAGVVVVETFTAVNPFAPVQGPLIMSLLTGAGLLSLLTAAGLAIAGVRRAQWIPVLDQPDQSSDRLLQQEPTSRLA
ncbi:MAG TPA: hypothetical protein VGQ62_09700, partial [Chloroflexota bacterium]|nr:hypothetical protein [Chloroflexota bacterium]